MKKIIFILCILASFMSGFAFKAVTETKSDDMKRVTGIGGIFFKSKDPKKMREWYKDHLGLATNEYGAVFEWFQGADNSKKDSANGVHSVKRQNTFSLLKRFYD